MYSTRRSRLFDCFSRRALARWRGLYIRYTGFPKGCSAALFILQNWLHRASWAVAPGCGWFREYFLFRVSSFWTSQNLISEFLEILRSLFKQQVHFLNRRLLPCRKLLLRYPLMSLHWLEVIWLRAHRCVVHDVSRTLHNSPLWSL